MSFIETNSGLWSGPICANFSSISEAPAAIGISTTHRVQLFIVELLRHPATVETQSDLRVPKEAFQYESRSRLSFGERIKHKK